MLGESVRFDDMSRNSNSEQSIPSGGVPQAVRQAADLAGLDAVAELYNEALQYANDGHLRLARERLQMLLCMSPNDGEARLLLAKVHVAGQRWQEALAALDEASSCGHLVAKELRSAVEDHFRADLAAEEERLAAQKARQHGELKALRQETKRLRSENAEMVGSVHESKLETKKWAWTTAGVSSLAILFVSGSLIAGLFASDATATDKGVEQAVLPPVALAAAASGVNLPGQIATVLATSPHFASVEVTIDKGRAITKGSVPAYAHKALLEQQLLAIMDVLNVDSQQLSVAARSKGTTHTVRSGDTLFDLSNHYYGDSTLNKKILSANRKMLRGRSNLSIDQVLVIPPVR